LTDTQRGYLDAAGHTVLKPQWDVDISRYKGVPEWFKAMTARPFLPNYIKNADVILWLDADIWVQDRNMLYEFVRAAQEKHLAICLELNRCYDNMFLRNASRENYYKSLSEYYSEDVANRLIHIPMMNCGAFAMLPDHRVWSLWQATVRQAITRTCTNFLEQTALNVSVYGNDIVPHFLPARYNWMACHSMPLLDEASGCFVEPNRPHDRIGLVHLACSMWKRNDLEYRTTTGRLCKGPLRPSTAIKYEI
jgi:hypothetical protein